MMASRRSRRGLLCASMRPDTSHAREPMHVTDLSVPIREGDGRLGLMTKFDTPYTFDT